MRLDFTANEIQVLNALLQATLNAIAIELNAGKSPPDRAAFLIEARNVAQKWLRATQQANPAEKPQGLII